MAVFEGQIWKSDNLEDYELVSVRWLDKGPLRLLEKVVRRIQYELRLPYAALFESFRYAQACRQELTECDLFYERMGWMGYGGSLAARWLGIPLVLEVNGDHLTEMEMLGIAPEGMQLRLSIALMKRAVHQASHVVAAGDGWRRQFIERWRVTSDKVSVVENGSEIVDLLSREQLRSFQPIGNLSPNTTIIYLGGFEPWHGVTILIKATAKAIKRGARVHLHLVGSGTQQNIIDQLINRLEIKKLVTLTGYLSPDQLSNHLAEADIGVSPYCDRAEYSGLKLLDYKAAGLAIIASGENGQPAVLEHGRTGWIVPPCDQEALCEALILLAMNGDLRRRLGRQARFEAERFHSWRHVAHQLDRLFQEIVKN